MSVWFKAVKEDLGEILNAIDHFEAEFDEAKFEIGLKGNLERHSKELPGIVAHRFSQLQEIEAILEHLNIMERKLHRKYFRKYLTKNQQMLSSRDAEKFADGEDEVIDMAHVVNEWALIRNKWLGLMKGLEAKSYQVQNIVKLRVAGLEDINL